MYDQLLVHRRQGAWRTRTGSAAVVGGESRRTGSTGLPLAALASDWTIPYDVRAVAEAAEVHQASRRYPSARATPNPGETEVAAERAAASRRTARRGQSSILGLPSAQVGVEAVAGSERKCVGGRCGLALGYEARTAQIQKDSPHCRSHSYRS